jgi:hypothetical protein
MLQNKTKTFMVLGFVGTLVTAVPFTTSANADVTSSSSWNQGQAELEKQLPPGMPADSYRGKLEQLGYKVTSTNYNNPDYLEYEIVKGDQTWEVQIDVDEDTHKATKVDIAHNVWQTDATAAALRQAQDVSRNTTAGASTTNTKNRTASMRNNQYSDRDRSTTDQLVRELDALPVGHDKDYYKGQLRQRGYDITRINKDERDELQLEAVKDGHSVQLEVAFDENTGRSTDVDASSLWAESASTTRARQSQERTHDARMSSDRTSMNNE